MNEFQMHGLQLMKATEDKHIRDLEENRNDLEKKLSINIKPSPELLNMRQIQANLAKQKEYSEAHKVQVRVQQLEREEQEKHLQSRMKKIAAAEAKLISKQQGEMNALRKRIDAGENEQKKQRALELERLLQRYQNVKKVGAHV